MLNGKSSRSLSEGNETGSTSIEGRKQAAKLWRGKPKQLLGNCMRLSGMTDVQTFWDPVLDTKCILAWNQSMMILSFRGTASVRNALSDLKVSCLAVPG